MAGHLEGPDNFRLRQPWVPSVEALSAQLGALIFSGDLREGTVGTAR
jgi:hypothetical protein